MEEKIDIFVWEMLSIKWDKMKNKSSENIIFWNILHWFLNRTLGYKAKLLSGHLGKVFSEYSSATCPKCLFTSISNRLLQASFKCGECGHKENADLSASETICLFFLLGLACDFT